VREFLDLIIELSTENKITVLLSSHQLHQVQQVCDRVGIFVKGRLLATGDIMTLASTLFSKNPYTVEVGINYLSTRDEDESGEPANNSQLVSKLKQLDGVNKINDVNGILQVECSRDITSDIVSLVISSGAQLTSLNMKEYGLDDIYYRYFEGGAAHD
jgi:ABC-2 type transport system ATP-binding protein